MSEIKHAAQQLRQAEVEFQLADRQSTRLDQERAPWQTLAPRRFATLCGIHSLLRDAARIYDDAGTDPQAPLAAAIHKLHDRIKQWLRNLLITYGLIIAVVLALAVILGWELYNMSVDGSPVITNPSAGDAVEMKITVTGSSPRGSLPSGTNLYILVRTQGYGYWLQESKPIVGLSGWQAEVGTGQENDPPGTHYRICAVLTRETLSPPLQLSDTPMGDSHCIDVTRK